MDVKRLEPLADKRYISVIIIIIIIIIIHHFLKLTEPSKFN